MNQSEFIAAALKVAPEDYDRRAPRLSLTLARPWRTEGVPDYIWHALTACYTARRLDSVCTGPDRHEKFALWLCSAYNWRKFYRVTTRSYRTYRRKEIENQIRSLTTQLATLRADLVRFGGEEAGV